MFALSTYGAVGILTGVAGISGIGFGLDMSALFAITGSKFAAADKHHPAEQSPVIAVRPPVAATHPLRPQPSDELARDLAPLPRTVVPPVAPVTAQAPATSKQDLQTVRPALHDDDAWAVPVRSEPAPAGLAGRQTGEAMLHDNASPARDDAATGDASTAVVASVPPDETNHRDRGLLVPPLPVPPNSSGITRSQVAYAPAEPGGGVPSALAPVRVSAVTPSKPWQLVAAVRALEALTDTGEPGAPP